MDKLLDKLGLYDFFVRMFTGLIVIVGAIMFGLIDVASLKDNDSSIVSTFIVLISGYAIGVVLEETLYIISEAPKWIAEGIERSKKQAEEKKATKKAEAKKLTNEKNAEIKAEAKKIAKEKKAEKKAEKEKAQKIEDEKKKKLIAAGYEDKIETPLIHAVMSGSCAIACVLTIILYSCKLAFNWDLTFDNRLSDSTNLIILLYLLFIFIFRRQHYISRRHKLIARYFDAFCGEENCKTQKESESTNDCT